MISTFNGQFIELEKEKKLMMILAFFYYLYVVALHKFLFYQISYYHMFGEIVLSDDNFNYKN